MLTKAYPGARTAEGPTGVEAAAPDAQPVSLPKASLSLPKVGVVVEQADGEAEMFVPNTHHAVDTPTPAGKILLEKMAPDHRMATLIAAGHAWRDAVNAERGARMMCQPKDVQRATWIALMEAQDRLMAALAAYDTA